MYIMHARHKIALVIDCTFRERAVDYLPPLECKIKVDGLKILLPRNLAHFCTITFLSKTEKYNRNFKKLLPAVNNSQNYSKSIKNEKSFKDI